MCAYIIYVHIYSLFPLQPLNIQLPSGEPLSVIFIDTEGMTVFSSNLLSIASCVSVDTMN